jgi:hypothetical protein
LYETIDPLLLRLADGVHRALEMHARAYSSVKIQHLFGVGGGFAQHGLLRRLRQDG